MSQPITRMTGAFGGAPISAVPASATTGWLQTMLLAAVSMTGGLARMIRG